MDSHYLKLMKSWPAQVMADDGHQTNNIIERDAIDSDIAKAISQSHATLANELLGIIHAQGPAFFETLVIDVLLAMGYGGRRRDLAARLGRSGDGGVDGVIAQDELGLDLIYMQAKRLKPGVAVALADVRDFAGSLDAHHAAKGVFVTTSHFSQQAVDFCRQVTRRVVLIDGLRFAELMIRHNIGVRVKNSYQVKRIDFDYFSIAASARRHATMSSDSIQPRR